MRKSKSIEEIFQKDIQNTQERNIINENYRSIKEYYKNKIKDYEDIQIERIYLEKKLLKYSGMNLNMSISIIVVIGTYFFNAGLDEIYLKKNWILMIISSFVVIRIFCKMFEKDVFIESIQNTYYNICLKILEELEEDFKSKDLDRIKEFHGIR